MERTIIKSGTIFNWHDSKEELPSLKDNKGNVTCLTLSNGLFRVNVWNQYYQCWDDSDGDDFEFSKEVDLLWSPLETISTDEIIKL
nr:MAG TPA: hypothetical protein [Caudoviricetes sp.]